MNSNYYIPPEACFKSVIQAIWQVEGSPAFQKELILPKGIVEVIFNFSGGSPIASVLGSHQYHLSQCFINGFNTKPIHTLLPRQHTFFGILFQPLAVKKIFHTPACAFSDRTVDLTLINPAFNTLWCQLAEQEDFYKRVAVFLGWLGRNCIDWQPREQLINHFLVAMNGHDLSVTGLANTLCYSPRQVSRKIFEATGLNAEEMILYKKYLHAVELIHQTALPLTEIGYQCHFSDQSHFIRTFKSFTNITPGEYKRNKSPVKGHIYEDVR